MTPHESLEFEKLRQEVHAQRTDLRKHVEAEGKVMNTMAEQVAELHEWGKDYAYSSPAVKAELNAHGIRLAKLEMNGSSPPAIREPFESFDEFEKTSNGTRVILPMPDGSKAVFTRSQIEALRTNAKLTIASGKVAKWGAKKAALGIGAAVLTIIGHIILRFLHF